VRRRFDAEEGTTGFCARERTAQTTRVRQTKPGIELPLAAAWFGASGLGYTMAAIFVEGMMARKDRLTRVAVGIGKAMGK
jgi:hypothetical protein